MGDQPVAATPHLPRHRQVAGLVGGSSGRSARARATSAPQNSQLQPADARYPAAQASARRARRIRCRLRRYTTTPELAQDEHRVPPVHRIEQKQEPAAEAQVPELDAAPHSGRPARSATTGPGSAWRTWPGPGSRCASHTALCVIGILRDRRVICRRLSHSTPARSAQADPEPVEHAVMGAAVAARPVIDRHRRDPPAAPEKQRGKIAVHVVEVGHRQEAVPREQLEAAAGVGSSVASSRARTALAIAARRSLVPRCPGDGCRASRRRAEGPAERGVPHDRRAAAGCRRDRSGRRHRGWRSRVPAPHALRARSRRSGRRVRRGGRSAAGGIPSPRAPAAVGSVVLAAVVHVHDLVVDPPVERAPISATSGGQIVGLVVDRHHHRQLGTHDAASAQAGRPPRRPDRRRSTIWPGLPGGAHRKLDFPGRIREVARYRHGGSVPGCPVLPSRDLARREALLGRTRGRAAPPRLER